MKALLKSIKLNLLLLSTEAVILSQKARIKLVKLDLPVVNSSWLFPVTLLHFVHLAYHSLPNMTESNLSKT